MRNSVHSGRSGSQDNDETKYTFNPVIEKMGHIPTRNPSVVPSVSPTTLSPSDDPTAFPTSISHDHEESEANAVCPHFTFLSY